MDIKYSYWCSDEKKWIYEWKDEVPICCVNNSLHSILHVSENIKLEKGGREVLCNDQTIKPYDSSDLMIETFKIFTEGESEYNYVLTWPFNIFIYQITLFPWEYTLTDDSIDIIINKGFVCGTITEELSCSNILKVSDSVLMYVFKPGWFKVTITNDTTNISELMGRVINVDPENSTITMEFPCINTYPIGSSISVDYYCVNNFSLYVTNSPVIIGGSKNGSKLLPANTPVTIIFKNRDLSLKRKTLVFQVEYAW